MNSFFFSFFPSWRIQLMSKLQCGTKVIVGIAFAAMACLVVTSSSLAGILYSDPSGGWSYQYDGTIADTSMRAKLDGAWVPGDTGSQNYDGSPIGGVLDNTTNRPGGASALTEGSTAFLRLQDPGNPATAGYGFTDPSNRRIKLLRNLGSGTGGLGLGTTLLDSGVTLSFRARLSTAATGVIDNQYPAVAAPNFSELGGQPSGPWATGGNGTVTGGSGNGMFSIRQSGGGGKMISFSLAMGADDNYFNTGTNLLTGSGLVTNLKSGTSPSANVDIGDTVAGATVNVVPIDEAVLDDWHEFWVTIIADTTSGGTHKVNIYMDGLLTPTVFDVTAGNGTSSLTGFGDVLALGDVNTGQIWGFDTDFFAVKGGVFTPIPEPHTMVLTLIGMVFLGFVRRRK
jgi:hypothetical protein